MESYQELMRNYSGAIKAYRQLSEAEKGTAEGVNLFCRIIDLHDCLKSIDSNTPIFRLPVGNYKTCTDEI